MPSSVTPIAACLLVGLGFAQIAATPASLNAQSMPMAMPQPLNVKAKAISIPFQMGETPVTGSFHIEKRGKKSLLVLSDDFSTNEKAPDLHLVVSPSSDPLKGGKPPYALQPGSYTVLSKLKAFRGGQAYEVPASIDLARNGSLLIWCRMANATMAWAPLR